MICHKEIFQLAVSDQLCLLSSTAKLYYVTPLHKRRTLFLKAVLEVRGQCSLTIVYKYKHLDASHLEPSLSTSPDIRKHPVAV